MADTDVPAEIFERGLCVCKQFLGGCWRDITGKDINISRVSGGASNMLYVVRLTDTVKTETNEPRKVLLRIYGKLIQQDPEDVIKDCVVYSLLAEKGVGPKLYGIFKGGRLEEYIENIPLDYKDLHRPVISRQCARLLARFHKLQMPLPKDPSLFFDTLNKYIDYVLENTPFTSDDKERATVLKKIQSFDIGAEHQRMKELLANVPSPIVFCHNDLCEGNMLYCVNENNSEDWKLIPIDCEFASYNYRGFDIGNLFCEWCYNYKCDVPPYFTASLEHFPTREQQMTFLIEYVKELDPTNTNVLATAECMLKEVAAYRLFSHFLWGVWCLVQDQMSDITYGYLENSLARLEAYFIQKEEFLQQYGRK